MADPYPPEFGPRRDSATDPAGEVKIRREVLARRLLLGTVMLLVLSSWAAMIGTVIEIRRTQLDGTPTGKKLVTSADRILDCTDPSGDKDSCYQRSQRETARVVGQIGAANILAVVCALQVTNGTPLQQALDQVTECVSDRLADAGKP